MTQAQLEDSQRILKAVTNATKNGLLWKIRLNDGFDWKKSPSILVKGNYHYVTTIPNYMGSSELQAFLGESTQKTRGFLGGSKTAPSLRVKITSPQTSPSANETVNVYLHEILNDKGLQAIANLEERVKAQIGARKKKNRSTLSLDVG